MSLVWVTVRNTMLAIIWRIKMSCSYSERSHVNAWFNWIKREKRDMLHVNFFPECLKLNCQADCTFEQILLLSCIINIFKTINENKSWVYNTECQWLWFLHTWCCLKSSLNLLVLVTKERERGTLLKRLCPCLTTQTVYSNIKVNLHQICT